MRMNPNIITNPVIVLTIRVCILLLCVGSTVLGASFVAGATSFPFLAFLGDLGATTGSESTGLRLELLGERTVELILATLNDKRAF